MIAFAILAGASLTFLPLGLFVRRVVTESTASLDMPPLPSGSLDRGAGR